MTERTAFSVRHPESLACNAPRRDGSTIQNSGFVATAHVERGGNLVAGAGPYGADAEQVGKLEQVTVSAVMPSGIDGTSLHGEG
jgi:hypothetical protein